MEMVTRATAAARHVPFAKGESAPRSATPRPPTAEELNEIMAALPSTPEEEISAICLGPKGGLVSFVEMLRKIGECDFTCPASVKRLEGQLAHHVFKSSQIDYSERKQRYNNFLQDPAHKTATENAFPQGFPSLRDYVKTRLTSLCQLEALPPETRDRLQPLIERVLDRLVREPLADKKEKSFPTMS